MVTSEMTQTNRSGGVDLAASVVNIDGDVVGRDKVVLGIAAVGKVGGRRDKGSISLKEDD